jgi:tRNA(His) 5'-end guanylyltransferase
MQDLQAIQWQRHSCVHPSYAIPRFSDLHGFEKPNDKRALDLMDECAKVLCLMCLLLHLLKVVTDEMCVRALAECTHRVP